jgi:hypothetical protein
MLIPRQLLRFTLCVAWCVLGCGPRAYDANGTDSTVGTASMDSLTGDDITATAAGEANTSDTTDDAEASETSETGELPPVCDHEFDTSSAAFECDPWVQDCPEGEKCVAWTNDGGPPNSTRCIPVARQTKGLGEPCTWSRWSSGEDDCEVGARCWQWATWSDREVRVCMPLCAACSEAPECPEGSLCTVGFNGALNLCVPECSPLEDTCPANSRCTQMRDMGCTFACASVAFSPVPHGEPCRYINECERGASCIDAETFGPGCEGANCCSLYCDPNDAEADPACDAATAGQSCVRLCDRENDELGVCGAPSP